MFVIDSLLATLANP